MHQLHIIENRTRIEKQILLGRQAVRKAMQPRSREPALEELPAPITGTQLPLLPVSRVSSQNPELLPLDSDAENAYVNGIPRAHRPHHHHHHSGRRGPGSPIQSTHGQRLAVSGQQHFPSVRRRWGINGHQAEAEDTDPVAQSDYGRATPDPPPPQTDDGSPPSNQSPSIPNSPTTLFTRLRTVSATFSPFATLRRNSRFFGQQQDQMAEPAWSAAESSSDDDDLSVDSRRHVRHPSILENWGDAGDESDGEDGR